MDAMDLANLPSGPPPPGVIPNFVNPPTQAPITKIMTTILLPLMILFVLLRLYSNIWISRKLEKSDYACLIATVAAISYSAVIYRTLNQHILGRHIWDVPISMNSNSSVQSFSVLNILYGPVIFLAKLSILLLYLQLFLVNRRTRIFVYIALTVNFCHALAIIIGNAILCVPKPGQSWEVADATYKCMVIADLLGVILGTVSVITDIFIFCIPIPVVWALQMPRRKRWGVSAIFATGIFACLASILALVYRINLYKKRDNTWNGAIAYMLTVIEINVSIMCSCMPSYASYLRYHMQTFQSLKSRFTFKSSKDPSLRKNGGSSMKQNSFTRVGSKQDDKMQLTLGSAVRDGEFLQPGSHTEQHVWPLGREDMYHQGKRTNRDAWDRDDQETMV